MNNISLMQALDYEIKSSRWIGFVSCGFIQELIGSHLARKTLAKHMRYIEHIAASKRVIERNASS